MLQEQRDTVLWTRSRVQHPGGPIPMARSHVTCSGRVYQFRQSFWNMDDLKSQENTASIPEQLRCEMNVSQARWIHTDWLPVCCLLSTKEIRSDFAWQFAPEFVLVHSSLSHSSKESVFCDSFNASVPLVQGDSTTTSTAVLNEISANVNPIYSASYSGKLLNKLCICVDSIQGGWPGRESPAPERLQEQQQRGRTEWTHRFPVPVWWVTSLFSSAPNTKCMSQFAPTVHVQRTTCRCSLFVGVTSVAGNRYCRPELRSGQTPLSAQAILLGQAGPLLVQASHRFPERWPQWLLCHAGLVVSKGYHMGLCEEIVAKLVGVLGCAPSDWCCFMPNGM